MPQYLLDLLPQGAHGWATALSAGGMALGLVLWLAGYRFSRSLVTLGCVAVGALAGLRLPQWMGWSWDGAATAIAAAVIVGIAGYMLHKLWLAAGFGVLLAIWAVAGTLRVYGADIHVELPQPATVPVTELAEETAAEPAGTLLAVGEDAWAGLPDELRRIIPVAALMAAVTGMACGLLWPRLAAAGFYSLLGMMLLLAMAWVTLQLTRPGLLEWLPARPGIRIVGFVVLVGLGMLAQWGQMRARTEAPVPVDKKPQSDADD